MAVTVCQTKRRYESWWEATKAAFTTEERFKQEMEPYPCYGHWHITHKNPEERRGAGHGFTRCDCGKLVERAKIDKHKCGDADE